MITDLLIYYLFFEGLFGATPAKFLTETRTVEYNGKLSFGALFKRTLCRFIPFERLAFLFGTRWHDTFSETGVVRKEQHEKMQYNQEQNLLEWKFSNSTYQSWDRW